MIAPLRGPARADSGSAIVEYALIITLVSLVSYLALIPIGDTLSNFFVASSAGLGNVAKYPQ